MVWCGNNISTTFRRLIGARIQHNNIMYGMVQQQNTAHIDFQSFKEVRAVVVFFDGVGDRAENLNRMWVA